MTPFDRTTLPQPENDAAVPQISLRAVARVRDIDRQLASFRFRRMGIQLVVFPGLAVIGMLLARRLLPDAHALLGADIVMSAIAIATAAVAFIASRRQAREETARLEDERTRLLSGASPAIRPRGFFGA